MRCVAILLALSFTAPVVSQENIVPDKQPKKILYQLLLEKAKEHFEQRKAEIGKLQKVSELRARQKFLRDKFIESLGGFPKRTPLNAKVVGKIQGDGFHVENVIYESQPDHHVTANLYIPDKLGGKAPGILLPCGHSGNGKAAVAYQRAAILLARNGFVVLCYDPIGQGERSQLLDDMGKPAIRGSTSEHTMCGIGSLLVGRNTATYRIWDGIRSLDYLASRPEVDAEKLGCTGNSGGGTLTSYLMALDPRIQVAAPSCYITSLEKLFVTRGPQDAEQNITGQVAFGMEHADYVTMRAPRPTLILCATKDFFDIDGTWNTFREAKMFYAKMGYGERVSLFEYPDGHGFSKPRREATVRWFRRWFYNDNKAIFESDFKNFTDKQLQCTRSGQVLADFRGKSVFHLNWEEAKRLAKTRATNLEKQSTAKMRKVVAATIGIPVKMEGGKLRQDGLKRYKKGDYGITQYVIRAEGMAPLPVRDYRPVKAKSPVPILYVDAQGMHHAEKAILKLVEGGRQVIAVDLRGMGETSPSGASWGRGHFGPDVRETFLSFHLNQPLLGQRVWDILTVMSQLSSEVEIIGVGAAGPVALHAAAISPRISKVTLEDSLVSWATLIENPICKGQLSTVAPGALKHYDLPELAAFVAPRPLTIRRPVDGMQDPVSQSELEKIYTFCRQRYQLQKAGDQLILSGASKN